MSSTSFDSFAEYYDEVMGDNGDYTHKNTIDPALFKATGVIKRKVVYDIGCGNGYIARKLHNLGAKEVWASDISPRLVKIAQGNYPAYEIKYLVQNGADFKNIPKNNFDLITMNMSIHYIKSLNHLFEGVNKSLKKGGVFAFTADHPYKPLSHFETKRVNNFNRVLESARKYLSPKKVVVYSHWSKKNDLIIYKRPLSMYVKALSDNGLLIKNLIEPKTKALKSYETSEKAITSIPSIFAIAAIKK